MVKELTGGYKIKYHANGLDSDPIEIDFTPPFRSLPYLTSLITDTRVESKNSNLFSFICLLYFEKSTSTQVIYSNVI